MISLSRIIKPTQYVAVKDLKYVESQKIYVNPYETTMEEQPNAQERQRKQELELEELRKQIMNDASIIADEEVRHASEQASRIVEEAKLEAEAWWQARREEDQQRIEFSQMEGFEQGYQEGLVKAQEEVRRQAEKMLADAQAVLEQAYISKEQIVQEAEPFVVNLSCQIAEKIVDQQLTLDPSLAIELIRKQLSRRKEQGMIALCVAPEHFAFVQAAREELVLAIDSQAELQILPDSTVTDWGCVIRSTFGSIDARIDTQLTEIKKHLLYITNYQEEQQEAEYA